MEEEPNQDKYELKIARGGQKFYYKNGRLTKRIKVPQEELVKLHREHEVETVDATVDETDMVDSEPLENDCLMCGETATRTRFVNLQLVHVCEEHYFNCTLGQLVIKLRELKEYEPVLPDS